MENFLEEILGQLVEDAFEAKENATNDFGKGSLFGYYNIISKILNQAEAFNILEKLPKKLQQFNPESLLNKLK